ncbi:MAG: hypothetical protein C3F15_08295 [Holophagae bacterium]|nr:MAG: hypothetical protein C3F15_08295 [Holophagae bacterium]
MPGELASTLAVVLEVVGILEELGVKYHLGGSFAAAVHGVPRQTRDADVVVDLDAGSAAQLVERLGGDFYIDANAAAVAVARRGTFNAIHLATGFKVDFFVAGSGDFDAGELDRSELQLIAADPPRSVWVKSAEDTVLRKLQWFRDGGEVSDRQWNDVLGILMAQGDRLDQSHLRRWSDALGVADLLDRALREAREA